MQHVRLKAQAEEMRDANRLTLLNGLYLPLDHISEDLRNAVVAREDQRFYDHHGIDWLGLARGIAFLGRRGKGSTIDQQLARIVFLSIRYTERHLLETLRRTFKELILAVKLNRYYAKDTILGMYLNAVEFGTYPPGIESAAYHFFGVSAASLDLYEAAILTQALPAPSTYSCQAQQKDETKDDALRRVGTRTKELLSEKMGKVVDRERLKATITRCQDNRDEQGLRKAEDRYLREWMLPELRDIAAAHDLRGRLTIVTTLHPRMQWAAQQAIADSMDAFVKAGILTENTLPQAALVAMSHDGAVRAMMGGRNFAQQQENLAITQQRQPGSTFKLFVYLAALEQGMTPRSAISDLQRPNWHNGRPGPRNWDNRYLPSVSLRDAFAMSRNAAAVNLLHSVRIESVVSLAERLGVRLDPEGDPGLTLALGTVSVSLLDMTAAYTAVANGGYAVTPYGVTGLRTFSGSVPYWRDAHQQPDTPVLQPATVDAMQKMLRAVVQEGTGKRAQFGDAHVGGKTGTTSGNADAWFIGCAPALCAGVWVGNLRAADAMPSKVNGGSLPADIFRNFMQAVHSAD